MCFPTPRLRGFSAVAVAVAALWVVCLTPSARAQNAASAAKPVYARLSDKAVLKLSAAQFEARYGKDLTGERLDDLLNVYADAQARQNDRTARAVSPNLAATVKTLRKRLAEWDYETFTPNDRFMQGIDRGHKDASDAIARETALKELIPLLQTKKPRPFVSVPFARAQLTSWIQNQEMGITPLPEELEGKSREERADVRAAYAAWGKRLKTQQRLLEGAAARLPVNAAEAFLLYAARWHEQFK